MKVCYVRIHDACSHYHLHVHTIPRSLSVAYITVDVSVNTDIIQLDTTGNDGSTFVLTVCANYNGRGLDNRPLSK